ncbi:MAG: class I SAM-dependent RNA methyltransferase [Gemmatimonadaceae bacterium]
MPRTVSLSIDAIAAGGDGVGRSDGLVVFVPRTAPGDVITASVAGKGHFARGSLRTIQAESALRVTPPCPHYTRDRCGGCQIQHIGYESQLAAKQRIITDAVARIGKRNIEMPPIVSSPGEWRYRTKLTLALRRRGAGWIGGLHPYDDPARVFALGDCPITERRVVSVWREVLAASRFFPDAPALRGSVRWTTDGATFILIGGTRWSQHAGFFAAVPSLVALYWEPKEQPRQQLGERRNAATPAASFAQVNPAMAELLGAYVLDRVLERMPARVIDAYSGAGDLSVALSERGVIATAIELDADAVRWAQQRLAPPSRAIHGRVEEKLLAAAPADVVVLNPPRGGLHEAVPSALETDARAPTLVYVSCDPATLARDIARLPSYQIASTQAFDMFPQTAHVETVCVLTLERP